jgi:hypothetical protein
LAEIAKATTEPQRHDILWQHACMISRGANRGILKPLDRQQINERLSLIAQQIGQHPAGVLLAIDEALTDRTQTSLSDPAQDSP